MKDYFIYADLTMIASEVVKAENEEEAKKIALERFNKEPYYYASKACACVNVEITDVTEE